MEACHFRIRPTEVHTIEKQTKKNFKSQCQYHNAACKLLTSTLDRYKHHVVRVNTNTEIRGQQYKRHDSENTLNLGAQAIGQFLNVSVGKRKQRTTQAVISLYYCLWLQREFMSKLYSIINRQRRILKLAHNLLVNIEDTDL